ncbi:MAG: amidohydrolase [Deltaproteobacteria bacterium]|nr:amidohydrolase [Deltaproteobacteria bacterium]
MSKVEEPKATQRAQMIQGASSFSFVTMAALLMFVGGCTSEGERKAADHVFTHGKIYTVDSQGSVAQALATRGHEILYVGTNEGVEDFLGANTEIWNLEGRLVLPGLHDTHIHPEGIVEPEVCDLESEARSLTTLVTFLKDCLDRYPIEKGDWFIVPQWAFSLGNQPSSQYPTIRTALDAVSTEHKIILMGNDGHHAAVNSATLSEARNAKKNKVGLSANTLQSDFVEYTELIGVDESGEPNGAVSESAIALFGATNLWTPVPISETIEGVAEILASRGITSIIDAMASRENLDAYKSLESSGKMTFRVRAAQFEGYYVPKSERPGLKEIPEQLATWRKQRKEFSGSRLIKADSVKVFADGVLEGNPLAQPPTLPNAASLKPFKQPVFRFDEATQAVEVVSYVDPQSQACQSLEPHMKASYSSADLAHFIEQYGHHPSQCVESRGVLEFDEDYLKTYIAALYREGFSIHVHTIGDRAVRVAVDSLEAARVEYGESSVPHGLAHAQLIHPTDQKRIGEMGLFVVFTHGWSSPEREYMMTVVPFIDQISSETKTLYRENNYYMQNAYPARSIQTYGGVVLAGSDAPVEMRDPAPFLHMEQAITRGLEGSPDTPPLNTSESLDIESIIEAYTINGAIAMSHSEELGSIEVGKTADFIVLDQDVINLAKTERTQQISETQVLLTVFDGEVVFNRGIKPTQH